VGLNIASIIGENIGSAFKDIVGSFKADPTVAIQVQERLAEAQLAIQAKLVDQVTDQIDVDKAEAQNANWWVAGWRPYIGWICGTALGFYFIVAPLGTWFSNLIGHPTQFPVLDMKSLMTILSGMLGFGGMRTYEKLQGVPGANKNL
jgi:Holin of 3TMs, for gene-transfer release